MGQSPFRVKTRVKNIFFISPDAMRGRLSQDEKKAGGLIARRKAGSFDNYQKRV
jgi:hypothetical protein